jgi:DNA-binding response OmpR family regulator
MSCDLPVLMIEDEESDAILVQRALSKEGINNLVKVVPDGVEAVKYIRGEGVYQDRSENPLPGVILIDMKMPRKNGLEVLEWLRHNDESAATPVIVLSGSQEAGEVAKAYRLGANAYMVKPTSFNELRTLLRATYDFWCLCEKPVTGGTA